MKIVRNNSTKVQLFYIMFGEVFECGGDLFIKVDFNGDLSGSDVSTTCLRNDTRMGLSLSSGTIHMFSNYASVSPVEGTFVEE